MKKVVFGLITFLFISINTLAADTFRLVLPGQTWAVELNLGNFEITDHGIYPDFSGLKMQAENHLNGLMMSTYIVPATRKMTSKEYRDMVFDKLNNSQYKLSQVEKYEKGNKAFTEYLIEDIPEYTGINQKNVFVYLVIDDSWIDVHLSKVDFKTTGQTIFDEFTKHIKVIDNYVPNNHENFIFGNYFYTQDKYENAINYYQKALDQEKVKSELPQQLWLVLVDNLGMAYGISGDLDGSRRVFDYGLSVKPEYPMFHYNIGCTYAEMGDLAKAIDSLSLAFTYKANMIEGESIPDPATDSSFAKFLSDEKFVAFLKTIGR